MIPPTVMSIALYVFEVRFYKTYSQGIQEIQKFEKGSDEWNKMAKEITKQMLVILDQIDIVSSLNDITKQAFTIFIVFMVLLFVFRFK